MASVQSAHTLWKPGRKLEVILHVTCSWHFHPLLFQQFHHSFAELAINNVDRGPSHVKQVGNCLTCRGSSARKVSRC